MTSLFGVIVRTLLISLIGSSFAARYLQLPFSQFWIQFKTVLRAAARAEGHLNRQWYAATALLLAALKTSADLYLFKGPPIIGAWLTGIPHTLAEFQAGLPLLLWSLPFIWIGLGLTLMRLTDAALPRWLSPFFFLPFINLMFFLILCLLPTREHEEPLTKSEERGRQIASRFLPHSKYGVAAVSVACSSLLGVLGVLLGAYGFENYGSPLFVGIPFCMGFLAALLYGAHTPRTLWECLNIAFVSVCFTSVLLVCFLIEGILCVAALFPIALALALVGALLGYSVQALRPKPQVTAHCSLALLLPLTGALALPVANSSTLRATTTIEIAAPANVVWKNVVAFSEISPPAEWLFLHGVAYPKRARIEGHGVGAIRYCEFSTGAFVEPITIWNEPRELRFDVTETPPALEEWNPLGRVIAPHLEGYFTSLGGQFLLTELSPTLTRIDATTWYSHRVAPEWYWQLWSEPVLHIIHRRVLEHIRQHSEDAYVANASSTGLAATAEPSLAADWPG